ncbi:MAG: SBBP repeat-containing protein [Bacteroidetes bacterium]|nr:SBBP repeat-containing protein [Bacteroidota bacterium]
MKKTFLLFLTILAALHLKAQYNNRFNGQGDFSDKFNAVLTDNSNNSYAAGYSITPSSNRDILLVKYDQNGSLIWKNVYDGAGNGPDEALAIAIDASNVYITGYQKGAGTGNDFITIKYDLNGSIVWTVAYNYLANESDQSNSITTDNNGNVYITGQSDIDPSVNSNEDYVTIKYNSAGQQQWEKRKNGFGNGTDRPVKVLTDNSNNVYVTGRSNNGQNDDYMTIKYNDAGQEQWVKLFDRNDNDRATDMVVDKTWGDVIVTGRSDNGSNFDYGTVKYNTLGTQQWQAIHDYLDDDRATHVALDGQGNVFVTGQSDFDPSAGINFNITTVVYNNTGVFQWNITYAGAAGNDEVPMGIVPTGFAECVITGYTDTDPTASIVNDMVTQRYDAAGNVMWTQTYNHTGTSNDQVGAATRDPNGNIVVVGFTETAPNMDALALWYDMAGNNTHLASYNGSGDNLDNALAMVTNTAGEVFLAGYTTTYQQDRNMCIVKIDANGNTAWSKQYNGTSSYNPDEAHALVMGANHIYVAGYLRNSNQSFDYYTLKLNLLGDTVWTRSYNYAAVNGSDKAFSVGIDASENVYVAGRSDQSPNAISNNDAFIICYQTNGTKKWDKRINGSGNGDDEWITCKVTTAGNVYAVGNTYNGSNTDLLIAKFDNAGNQQWLKTLDGANGNDEARGMYLDNNENVYVTGFATASGGTYKDIVTLKYDNAGNLQWNKTYSGPGGANDNGKAITADGAGNVYVAGNIDIDNDTLTSNDDVVVLKYDGNGNYIWAQANNGAAIGNDDASDITMDAAGNIIIASTMDNTTNAIPNLDYATIYYDANGQVKGKLVYNGSADSTDSPNALLLHNNAVYITGGSGGVNTQRDMLTQCFNVVQLDINNETGNRQAIKIFPNPATTLLMIAGDYQQAVTVTIHDANAKLIFQKNFDGDVSPSINVSAFAQGTYTITVTNESGEKKESKFLIQR